MNHIAYLFWGLFIMFLLLLAPGFFRFLADVAEHRHQRKMARKLVNGDNPRFRSISTDARWAHQANAALQRRIERNG